MLTSYFTGLYFEPLASRRPRNEASDEPRRVKAAECVFFARGKCKYGDDCRFLHLESSRPATASSSSNAAPSTSQRSRSSKKTASKAPDSFSMDKIEAELPKSAVACAYFAKGECTRGDRCRFAHVAPVAPAEDNECPICMLPVVSPKMYGLLCTCSLTHSVQYYISHYI